MTRDLVSLKGKRTFKENITLFKSPYSIIRDWNQVMDEFTQGLTNFCLVKK